MENKKLNTRTFYEAIVEADPVITPEMVEFAMKKLEQMNETNQKNRMKERKPSEKELAAKAANDELYKNIIGFLGTVEEPVGSKTIAEHFETSFQRVCAVIRTHNDGEITITETSDGKKAYKLA